MKRGELKRLQINDPPAYDGVNAKSGDWSTPQVPRGKVWILAMGSQQSLMTATVGNRIALLKALGAAGEVLAVGAYTATASQNHLAAFVGGAGGQVGVATVYIALSLQSLNGRPYLLGGSRFLGQLDGAKVGDQLSTIVLYVWEVEEKDFDALLAVQGGGGQ